MIWAVLLGPPLLAVLGCWWALCTIGAFATMRFLWRKILKGD